MSKSFIGDIPADNPWINRAVAWLGEKGASGKKL